MIGNMNKENVLYPSSLKYMIDSYLHIYYHCRYGQALHMFLPFISPFILMLFPLWYVMDVMGNIYDLVCMKIFVDLPLWGLLESMKLEDKYMIKG